MINYSHNNWIFNTLTLLCFVDQLFNGKTIEYGFNNNTET